MGAVVGGFLVFFWQTLSWTVLNLHVKEYQKAPGEEAILNLLNSQMSASGQYILPHIDEQAGFEEGRKAQEQMTGKPWAVISYHQSYQMEMLPNILRGLLTSILSVFMVCWILLQNPNRRFGNTLISTLFIGLTGYLFIPYTLHIWYATPDARTNLTDTLLSWGLCGGWLGWWLPERK